MTQYLRYVALLLVALDVAVIAQVSSGTITGSVRDSSNAAIAGAKVKITQTATSVSRETVTDERGEFSAPNLRPGVYSVTVTSTGFQGRNFTGIVLAVDRTVNLTAVDDFAMLRNGQWGQVHRDGTLTVEDSGPTIKKR